MMDSRHKNKFARIGVLALLFAVVFFVGSTDLTHAQSIPGVSSLLSGVGDVAYTVIGKIVFAISYIVAYIAGVLIGIDAWLVSVMLAINTGVFSSQIVMSGFSVTLGLANLGFVLGIIIIALATILRKEAYGIKSLLWKLVVAAILVNFSLVIAAPIFNFGNSLTQYFLNCVDPTSGGCNGNGNGLASTNDFAKNIAGAFNPQNDFLALNNLQNGQSPNVSSVSGAFAVTGQDISKMLVPILSLVFVGGSLVAIAIVLGGLAVMLLVRYVYIAILAVLMPLAWLMWIFPGTKGLWSKWWDNFFRWTFFAPIVVFFLWLGMITITQMSAGNATGTQNFALYTSNSNPLWASISGFFTNLITPLIQTILSQFVAIGLMLGGIIVANSMSITGASATVGAAKWVGDQTKGYVVKQGKKGARAGFRNVGGEGLVARMRTGEFGRGRIGTAVSKTPLVGAPAQWVTTRLGSVVGRSVDKHLTNKDLVEDAKKSVPDDPKKIKEDLLGNMNMQNKLASVAKLIEKNEMTDDVMVGNQTGKEFFDQNKEVIEKNYGQGKLSKDADKTFGSDYAMRSAEKEISRLALAGADTSAAIANLDAATQKFLEGLSKSDAAKMNVNEALGKKGPLSKALAKGLLKYAPQLVPSALPKMKSPALKTFRENYEQAYNNERFRITADKTLSDSDRAAQIDQLTKSWNSFNNSLGNNAVFSAPDSAAGPGSATPPATGPSH